MRRGPKGVSPETQAAKGDLRPCRVVVNLFDGADSPQPVTPDEFPPPLGMKPAAAALWREKVARYLGRGQKVAGFQNSLRVYCELEVAVIDGFHTGKVTMAMVTAHRGWANEFFDTPASQRVKLSSLGENANKFTANGRRNAASA